MKYELDAERNDVLNILLAGNNCFASGQLYTALSRVRKLADLTIDRPIRYGDIIADRMVLAFLEQTFTRYYPRD